MRARPRSEGKRPPLGYYPSVLRFEVWKTGRPTTLLRERSTHYAGRWHHVGGGKDSLPFLGWEPFGPVLLPQNRVRSDESFTPRNV